MSYLNGMYKHCPKCAGELENRFLDLEERNRLICSKCGFIFYQNPIPAAAVVAVQDGKVLLVRRKYEPRIGYWSLPAGFVECGESVEETAIRETMEETNLDIKLIELANVYSGSDDPKHNIVLIVYRGEIVGGELKAGDDASEVKFFPQDNLPKDIAFRNHRRALEDVIENKV